MLFGQSKVHNRRSADRKKCRHRRASASYLILAIPVALVVLLLLEFADWRRTVKSVEETAKVAALMVREDALLGHGPVQLANSACEYIRDGLKGMPNAAHFSQECDKPPLYVSATVSGSQESPRSRVRVEYSTRTFYVIPRMAGWRTRIDRSCEVFAGSEVETHGAVSKPSAHDTVTAEAP